MDTKTSNLIIDALGGTSETARICDVRPPSVSEWRKNGIPKTQLKFLRLARPEVFLSISDEKRKCSGRRSTDKARKSP